MWRGQTSHLCKTTLNTEFQTPTLISKIKTRSGSNHSTETRQRALSLHLNFSRCAAAIFTSKLWKTLKVNFCSEARVWHAAKVSIPASPEGQSCFHPSVSDKRGFQLHFISILLHTAIGSGRWHLVTCIDFIHEASAFQLHRQETQTWYSISASQTFPAVPAGVFLK